MQTKLRTSNKVLVPVVLLVINGLFNALSFFVPLISLKTGQFDGIARPLPVTVAVLVLVVVLLVAAWGLLTRRKWGRTVALVGTIILLLLAIVGTILPPLAGGELDLDPIIDIPLNIVILVILFQPAVKQALA